MQLVVHALLSTVVLISLSAINLFCFAQSASLPRGWRLPTEQELSDDWRRTDSKRKAEIHADFDGDGKEDEAVLLMSADSKRLGLFVFLSSDLPVRWHRVDVLRNPDAIHIMGIAPIAPGAYATACGKGYFSCVAGEPKEIRLQTQAIDYFKWESSHRIIYFDRKNRVFRKHWMSD